jgi:hypothetical protein
MKAGYAEIDITPPQGTAMCAFPRGPEKTPRISEGIHDPLKVRVLVLDDGVNTVAITSCDLILWQTVDALEIRQQAEQLSDGKIAACNIMLCCTHTHSSFENTYLFGGDLDDPQIVATKAAIARTICQALESLSEAELFFSQVAAPFNHNRRVAEDGVVSALTCNRNEHTTGVTDPTLSLLRCDLENGKSLLWVNWTGHALTLGPGNNLLTADYPGALIERIVEQFPGSEALFTNGCAGNIHPCKSMRVEYSVMDEIADCLKDKVEQANAEAVKLPIERLSLDYQELRLPYRTDEKYEITVPLACLTLGNLKIGFLPGEPFVEFQLRYREAMLPNYAFVNGYCNGWTGYLPTAAAFKEGGYGADFFNCDRPPEFNRTQICPGDGEVIIDKLIELSVKK